MKDKDGRTIACYVAVASNTPRSMEIAAEIVKAIGGWIDRKMCSGCGYECIAHQPTWDQAYLSATVENMTMLTFCKDCHKIFHDEPEATA